MLHTARLQGRIERLGGDRISEEEYAKALDSFEVNFCAKKKADVATVFQMFDWGHAGKIDLTEMRPVMAALGVPLQVEHHHHHHHHSGHHHHHEHQHVHHHDHHHQHGCYVVQLMHMIDRRHEGFLT